MFFSWAVCSSDLFQALRCLNCFSYFILFVLPGVFRDFLFYDLTHLHIFCVVSGVFVLYHFSTLLHQSSCRVRYFRLFPFLGLFCYAHGTSLDHFSHVLI